MIITISGASCTGKTTLLNNVRELVTDGSREVCIYEEFIRKLFISLYVDKYDNFSDLLRNPLDTIELHKETARHFNDILWSSDLNSILVFDRSPIDIAIYMYLNVRPYLGDSEIMKEFRNAANYVHRCIEDFMNHDPLILYTRPFDSEVEEDGFRPQSLIQQRELEVALFDKEFLSKPGVHVLPSKLEDRVLFLKTIF